MSTLVVAPYSYVGWIAVLLASLILLCALCGCGSGEHLAGTNDAVVVYRVTGTDGDSPALRNGPLGPD